MRTLIELESETEEGNILKIDVVDDKEIGSTGLYITTSNSDVETQLVIRLTEIQVIELVKVLHGWLES